MLGSTQPLRARVRYLCSQLSLESGWQKRISALDTLQEVVHQYDSMEQMAEELKMHTHLFVLQLTDRSDTDRL